MGSTSCFVTSRGEKTGSNSFADLPNRVTAGTLPVLSVVLRRYQDSARFLPCGTNPLHFRDRGPRPAVHAATLFRASFSQAAQPPSRVVPPKNLDSAVKLVRNTALLRRFAGLPPHLSETPPIFASHLVKKLTRAARKSTVAMRMIPSGSSRPRPKGIFSSTFHSRFVGSVKRNISTARSIDVVG